jgi:hypothetical protein
LSPAFTYTLPPQGVASIPDRIAFAWQSPEQRFEWLHVTRRRFFRNLCNMPGELFGWAITTQERGKKPLLPDLSGGKSYKNAGQWIDSSLVTGMLFKQVLDVGAKFGLAAFVNAAVTGYNRDRDYQELIGASGALRQLAAYTVQQDPDLREWAQALAARDDGALLRLSRHAEQASQVFMQFCQGSLLPTQENLARLQDELEAIAALCDRKAGVVSAPAHAARMIQHPALGTMQQHAPQAASAVLYPQSGRPSDAIGEVLRAKRLQDSRQAALYLAALSGLVADGAIEISSDVFVPKEEQFFSAQDAKRVAKCLRESAVLRQSDPQAKEIIKLANSLKTALPGKEQQLESMLAYADVHFAEIDRNLLLTDQPSALSAPQTFASVIAGKSGSHKIPRGEYYKPRNIGLDYVVRDEARHEMLKLYSRSLPTCLYQAPINLVERLILPNANGKWEFNPRIVGSEMKAAAWQALYNPLAQSYGGVATYEMTRLGLHQAAEIGKRMDAFMAAAVTTMEKADPDFAAALQGLSSRSFFQQQIDAHREMLSKPATDRNESDYEAIGMMMRNLAENARKAQKEACKLLTGREDTITLREKVGSLFSSGAKTTGDALMVITLMRFLEQTARGQILSYEFVDPDGMVLDKDSLKQVSHAMLAAAEQQGLAISGESLADGTKIGAKEGIAAGLMVRKQADGHYAPAGKAELIEYANAAVNAMTQQQSRLVQKFFTAAKGKLSETMLRDLEQAMLQQFSPTASPLIASQPSVTPALAPVSRKHPQPRIGWSHISSYVTRPEAMHEMRLLCNRHLAIALFGFPVKIATNILRGDFKKISTAFGKWSLASTAFATVANTLSPSYGAVAMKEAVSVGNITLKQDAEQAGKELQQTLTQLGNSQPGMRERLIASLGVNPLLTQKEAIECLAVKGEVDAALNQTATALIDHTLTALSGKAENLLPQKIGHPNELFTHVLELPKGNPAYAALKLAALSALVDHEQRYIDVLRFEGSSARLIDNKGLRHIVNAVRDRFYTEGEKLASASAEYLTAIADDLADKALPCIALAKKHKTDAPSASERMMRQMTATLSQGLR